MELLVPPGNQLNGNCGVTAVAAVAGVHFDEAFALLKKIESRNSNWRGSTHVGSRKKALKELGVKFAETVLGNYRRPTLATWIEWKAKPDAVYVVTTTGHVQVVHGRTVLDQKGTEDIADYWGKNKRVRSVLLIENPRMVANTQPDDTVEVIATEPETDAMKPNKEFIVSRLSEVGKTQMAMAVALDIDRAQVTRLLNGLRKVQLDEVPIMARFLDISTIEMLRNLGLDV